MTVVRRQRRASPAEPAPLRRTLSAHTNRLLRSGTTCTCHANGRRSCCRHCANVCRPPRSVQWSVMLGMVNGGWTEEDAWQALIDPTNQGGLYLQERYRHNKAAARSGFHREFLKAVSFLACNPVYDPHVAALDLVLIRDAVANRPDLFAAGRAGVSERAVVRALVERGLRASSRIVRVSMRQLAEDIDVRPGTVSDALARLENRKNFVTVYKLAAVGRASAYLLAVPGAPTTVTGGLVPPVPAEDAVTVVGGRVHRLFGANGLPLGALETYARLPAREAPREVSAEGGSPARGGHHGLRPEAEVSAKSTRRRRQPRAKDTQDGKQSRPLPAAPVCPLPTAAELARWMGRPPSTVMRHLRLMERHGLVHQDEYGRWERLRFNADALADELGIEDDVPRKHARHRRERRGYLEALVGRGHLVKQSIGGRVTYVDPGTGEVVATLDADALFGYPSDRSAV